MSSTRREVLALGATGLAGLTLGPRPSWAGPLDDSGDLTAKAVAFLLPRQGKDGSWSGDREPGITALVVTALLRSKRVLPDDPAIARGLGFLEQYVGEKGGLAKAPHSVYSTSVALMAFHEANKSGKYDAVVRGSQAFLREAQLDDGEGKGAADPQYGGLGYDAGKGRPDLSNTAFMVEALHDSGVPADDPALRRALVFVSRCQNLKSEFNDQPWAEKVNDGGFVYTGGAPAARGGGGEPGKSKAQGKAEDANPNAGIRSAAGMTYAGLKSMLYAGLKPDDLRVRAALEYIARNYTLDENPGSGQRGLYYYYLMFARAMATLGSPTFADAEGKPHDWHAELTSALAKRQDPAGAWANKDDRFMEGDPHIATSFALMALAAR